MRTFDLRVYLAAKLKIEQIQSKLKDEDDDKEVLKNIVKNKEEMILTLKSELDSSKATPVAISMPLNSCDQCDFKSESNKGLKIHMGKMHEAECPECNEIFGGELKLKTHMCRVHVANPSFKHFYMKNWFVR